MSALKQRKEMTMRKRIGIAVLIAMVGVACLQLSGRFSIPDVPAFISTAVAQMSRTISPVRVQNTARSDWSGCIPSVGGC